MVLRYMEKLTHAAEPPKPRDWLLAFAVALPKPLEWLAVWIIERETARLERYIHHMAESVRCFAEAALYAHIQKTRPRPAMPAYMEAMMNARPGGIIPYPAGAQQQAMAAASLCNQMAAQRPLTGQLYGVQNPYNLGLFAGRLFP